jgi:hypothetical protein
MRSNMIFRKCYGTSIIKFIILITVPITLYMMLFFDYEQERINEVNHLSSYEKFNVLFKNFDKIIFENYNQKKKLILLTPDKNKNIHFNAYKSDLSYYNGLSAAELFSLLKKANAFLLDIEILKNINVLSYLDGLKRVSNFQKRSSLITFGIHPDSFHLLNEVIA